VLNSKKIKANIPLNDSSFHWKKKHIAHKNKVFGLLVEQAGFPQNQALTASTAC